MLEITKKRMVPAMFLEVHILQNFALSNLNRDDTGAPKSCVFGGTRRARISSQCMKRAVRTYVREQNLIPSEKLSYRTKFIKKELVERLIVKGIDGERSEALALYALAILELKLKDDKTEYLIMLSESELNRIADLCIENSKALMEYGAKNAENDKAGKKGKKDNNNQLGKIFLEALNAGDAVDIALFGRMIATHAEKNVDAAVQMAHAISTNAVANEFDFYSAVDDLQQKYKEKDTGAGMLGTMLFNSSCYYRYANLDVRQLTNNLNGNIDLAMSAVQAFLEGMVYAVPVGKQTNSGAQNKPSLVMLVVRDTGLSSLVNAFVKPVYSRQEDIEQASAGKMLSHWNSLLTMYDGDKVRYTGIATYHPAEIIGLNNTVGITHEKGLSALFQRATQEIQDAVRN
jgi:CRISPR system Cascade subunit CasC